MTSCASVTAFAVTVTVLFFPALMVTYSSSPAARLHFTVPLSSAGIYAADSTADFPPVSFSAPVTVIARSTIVTSSSPTTWFSSFAVARTVTVPAAVAVRRPFSSMLASPVTGITLHVKLLSHASAGLTSAVYCAVVFTPMLTLPEILISLTHIAPSSSPPAP